MSLVRVNEISREALLTKRGTEDSGRSGRDGGGRAQRNGALRRGQCGPRQANKAQRETVHRERMYVQLKAKRNERRKRSKDAQLCIS
jgi:hypothetical protein